MIVKLFQPSEAFSFLNWINNRYVMCLCLWISTDHAISEPMVRVVLGRSLHFRVRLALKGTHDAFLLKESCVSVSVRLGQETGRERHFLCPFSTGQWLRWKIWFNHQWELDGRFHCVWWHKFGAPPNVHSTTREKSWWSFGYPQTDDLFKLVNCRVYMYIYNIIYNIYNIYIYE